MAASAPSAAGSAAPPPPPLAREDPSTVFVRNLPPETTAPALEAHLSALVGPVRRCVVVADGGGAAAARCRGFAFVQFALRADARRALARLDGALFRGRKMRPEPARRRMRSGGRAQRPPAARDPARGQRDQEGDGGRGGERAARKGRLVGSVGMRTVVVRRKERGRELEVGLVKGLLERKDCAKVESLAGSVDGCEVRCLFASWPEAGRGAAQLHGEMDGGLEAYVEALYGGKKCKLIVRNLPFQVDSAAFRAHFESIAPVREVSFPPSKAGAALDLNGAAKLPEDKRSPDAKMVPCPGFAFVEYFLAADANHAMAKLNGTKIEGRIVAIDLALPKSVYEAKRAAENVKNNPDGSESPVRKRKRGSESAGEAEGDADAHSGDEAVSQEGKQAAKRRKKEAKSTPEELERTVFIRNILYETSSEELRAALSKAFGLIEQSVLVMDKVTKRPRGSAFVRFASVESANAAVASSTGKRVGLAARLPNLTPAPEPVTLAGRELLIAPAVDRAAADALKSAEKAKKKTQAADRRNVHLAPIGHIVAGTPEARGLSSTDLAKRAAADKAKRNKLAHNPHAFVSPTRLAVRNLPRTLTQRALKELFGAAAGYERWRKAGGGASDWGMGKIEHVKIVCDAERKNRSRGFGFVMFAEHEDAMAALEATNNNPNLGRLLMDYARMGEQNRVAAEDGGGRTTRKRAEKMNARMREMQERVKVWHGRRLVVEFAVEDRRQVRIIERLKSKGKELKVMRKAEDEEKKGGKREKSEQDGDRRRRGRRRKGLTNVSNL